MSRPDPKTPDVELSPTGRVILGMIAFGKRTGYEIKTFVDKTTRYFWAASYGQIYPELKRLEDQGLVRGRPEPSGGRARTVYELTAAGKAALEHWLEADDEPSYELRDEGMLKLFFSGRLSEKNSFSIPSSRSSYDGSSSASSQCSSAALPAAVSSYTVRARPPDGSGRPRTRPWSSRRLSSG